MAPTDRPVTETRQLMELTRDELNGLATGAGVPEPERLNTKAEVAAAIEAVREEPMTVLVGEGGPELVRLPAPIPNAEPRPEGEPIVYRYTGNGGEFFAGIPARDLSASEAEHYAAVRPDAFHAMTTPAAGRSEALYERVGETD